MHQATYIIVIFPFFRGSGKPLLFSLVKLRFFEAKLFWSNVLVGVYGTVPQHSSVIIE